VDDFLLTVRSDSVLCEPLYVGGFEADLARWMERTVRPGMRVMDVGANVGIHTLRLARKVGPAGHVWSFEPYAPVADLLRHNVRLNGLDNVTVIEQAASDTDGPAMLHVFPEGADVYNSLGACRREENLQAVGTVPVLATRLDAFADAAGIDRVDLIKVDIEGAEERAIRGARRLIERSPGVAIVCELYQPSATQCGCNVQDLVNMLREWGFAMYVVERRGLPRPLTLETFRGTYAVFRRPGGD